MADELKHAPLTDAQFAVLKMYCKIDQDFEDGMLDVLVNDAATEIASAVQTGLEPAVLLAQPTLCDRYFSAIMKQVKENYDYRGEGAEIMRYPLLEPVVNTINQLRTEVAADADQ
ncbi:head-tail connector protein [Loigolactobacillus bifermentans]|uniref:Phage gp6-like head-tail connector protein n=1 Tax=Loigolactobacillus bifermentans DSM 20003 TaxID=1423726 RepID=A0A0R1H346_9LACO|nr:head-tail connector protein [Loigolactobacillus bifermentans]KRK40896.1 hypothetical protein FC07_GL002649 [Loigolactobacillus bifermentans DSM 20003]QGG59648.1 phage gp6-like head-tail connector protein [Loigolactobacillus bifermentans]